MKQKLVRRLPIHMVLIGAVVVFSSVTLLVLVATRADSNVSLEAENFSSSSNIDVISSGGASGGSYVEFTQASTGGPDWTCPNPTVYSVSPSNIASILNQAKSVPCSILNFSPGTYSPRISPVGITHATLRCTQPQACNVGEIRSINSGTIVIEDMNFFGGFDYGSINYNVSNLLVRNNVFQAGRYTHDISTKNEVGYAEIINNRFIRCERHCLELGQNGNIRTRPSTSGITIVRNNTFENPQINAITNRATCTLIVENNTFINVSGWTVITWPYWAKYPYGHPSDDGTLYIPKCPVPKDQVNGSVGPLHVRVVGNTFQGSTRVRFEGRGIEDIDTVYIKDNNGSYSCSRINMASSTQAATADEQTADPPTMAPGSDPC